MLTGPNSKMPMPKEITSLSISADSRYALIGHAPGVSGFIELVWLETDDFYVGPPVMGHAQASSGA